jgi:dihydrofolate reductase
MNIAIAAYGKNTRAIGRDNKLIWENLEQDLNRFRAVTRRHPIIMGRKTWESLPRQPLPDRTNIIITRDQTFEAPRALIAHSIEEAFELAREAEGAERTYIIGGGEIYRLALPLIDEIDATEVYDDTPGTVLFPEFTGFTEVSREPHEENGIKYDFVLYRRVSTS